ncbi:venom acid phosphatase Acph-1-like [Leptopilina boulardi]|uniref:venom acid phosphatase Acph-1-like n=1 Tax=Leptopilina boulardi TaxID=63433 RepID=UPI0021F633F5|nr:venom acid phosphatase Acph-1-like [Leptopilina boulardi]XP_051168238.1 venom acid phosphatase Acph-1-like [Leptopilina boulardi]
MIRIFFKYFIFISIVCLPVWSANTLKLISVVFRHGDRTPVPPFELYPKDPHKILSFTPPGHGKLTQSGQLRANNLGIFLRNTYNEFLETNYSSGFVEARSTKINRTQESLKLVLKGLYPEASVPVIVNPIHNDYLFFPQMCIRYNVEYVKAKLSKDVKDELNKLKDFRKNLTNWTGKKIKSALDMYFIYTTLECENFMNLTLPPWTIGVYPDGDLLKGSVLEYKIMNYNKNMIRQNGGMLVKKFIEDMKAVGNGSMDKKRKIMLYSAHDITVAAVLKALDVYYPHVPKFSSAVIVELHLIEQKYFVKILYYLGVPGEMKELQIPGCNILCSFDEFINLTRNIVPVNLNSCKQNRDISKYSNNYSDEITNRRKESMKIFLID